jgi:hypothetical protein
MVAFFVENIQKASNNSENFSEMKQFANKKYRAIFGKKGRKYAEGNKKQIY